MADYVTGSGLVVTDRRHDRALPPNGNPPSTVGPDHTSPGRNVMYPGPQPGWPDGGWHSEEWDGWPVDWQTPWREDFGHGSSLPGAGWSGGAWTGYGAGRANPALSKLSTAMTCVDLNARQLASFPVYGMTGDRPTTLPEWASSPEPELYESWPAFMLGALNSLQLRGEVVLLVTGRMANGRIARFIAVNPDTIDVEWIDGRRVFSLAGEELPAEDVLLTRYQTLPGRLRGVTPLEWAAGSLTTASSLERYAAGLATKGGVPWAVLKGRGNLSAQQVELAQRRWVEASQRRDGAPAVLGNEWDIMPLTISPKDMALLELREFDERRVASAFGVPAYLVNIAMAGGLTYSNAESLFFQHWTSTLRPLANLLAAAWSRWLLPRGQRLEFSPDRYTQPPFAQRVTAWQQLFSVLDPVTGQRAITIDEIRAAERLAPLDPTGEPSAAAAQTLTGYSQDGDGS